MNGINDLLKIKTTSRGLEYGTSSLVPVMNQFWVKPNEVTGIKSTVAGFDPKNLPDTIKLPQPHHKLTDDGVKPRTKAATCHDGSTHLFGIEEYLFPGTSTVVGQVRGRGREVTGKVKHDLTKDDIGM